MYHINILCRCRSRYVRDGFTLIEMLIVVSLFSLVSLAIYTSIASGLNVWDRSRGRIIEEDIAIFFDKISMDLRNSFFYSKIEPVGSKNRFSFPCRVWVPADSRLGLAKGEYVEQLGKVEYFFDRNKHQLIRRIANYSQALADDYGSSQALLNRVEDVYFRYFYFWDNKEVEAYKIENGVLPSRVKACVVISDPCGNKRTISKYIDVPIGML